MWRLSRRLSSQLYTHKPFVGGVPWTSSSQSETLIKGGAVGDIPSARQVEVSLPTVHEIEDLLPSAEELQRALDAGELESVCADPKDEDGE